MTTYGAADISTPEASGTNKLSLKHIESSDDERQRRLLGLTCSVCCLVAGEGYDIGVLNGAMVLMKEYFHLSSFDISLVASLTPLFVLVGCPLGGHIADTHGRHFAMLITSVFLMAGPLIMAAAEGLAWLLVGRAIVGCGIGMGFVAVSMLLTEITPCEHRGWIVSMEEVFLVFGTLLGFFANYALLGIPGNWRIMLALGALMPVCIILVLTLTQFIPESPKWLLQRGRTEEATEIMHMYLSEEEVQETLKNWQESNQQEFVTWDEIPKICTRQSQEIPQAQMASERKMLAAGLLVGISQCLCGYLFVVYFSSTLMSDRLGEKQAFFGTLLMGVVRLVMVFVAMYAMRFVGRRSMLMASSFIMCLACLWIAIAFEHRWGAYSLIGGFVLFMAGLAIGFGPITFVYCAEAFPTRLRSKAMSLCLSLSRIVGVMSAIIMPFLADEVSNSFAFYVQAGLNVIIIGLVWVFVFETKDCDSDNLNKVLEDENQLSPCSAR